MLSRLSLTFKALQELGPKQLGLLLLYKVGIYTRLVRRSGHVRAEKLPQTIQPLFDLPNPTALRRCIGQDNVNQLVAQANEIVNRRVRLFGGEPVPLDLTQPDDIPHWTAYEISHIHPTDIKLIWEPARFGWAFTLGRAYLLTRDERYPQVFWLFAEEFWAENPVNRGPNWVSAQEVALRSMAFVFAGQVFANSIYTTPERLAKLAASIAEHAARIPPTLLYAQAQNNNHLLSEATGLITAALALPKHPHARRWAKLGWKWFNHGLENQIAEDGEYIQHSTNYHRLMLQLALWVQRIGQPGKLQISKWAAGNLQLATRWLSNLADPLSQHVPNLGPNDGAYIFPFTTCPFDDYRPVLQAASQAFLGHVAFEAGPWDEMMLWMVGTLERSKASTLPPLKDFSIVRSGDAWAYLRAVRFTSRPGHADQLHVDLWWQGLNVALDAGTYLYNAHTPWDNRLSSAFAHNTVTVNGQDQMRRAGKFLYLDWAHAEILPNEKGEQNQIVASHNGYRRLNLTHQRTVTALSPTHWRIEDSLLPDEKTNSSRLQPVTGTLHWLLPDWPYELQITNNQLYLQSPHGKISIQIKAEQNENRPIKHTLRLIRAGQTVYGSGSATPILGWYSPTYGQKIPALSLCLEINARPPLRFVTDWHFPAREG